jgi:hypothetical protein
VSHEGGVLFLGNILMHFEWVMLLVKVGWGGGIKYLRRKKQGKYNICREDMMYNATLKKYT